MKLLYLESDSDPRPASKKMFRVGRGSTEPNVLQVKPILEKSKLNLEQYVHDSVETFNPANSKVVGIGIAACVGLRVKLSEKVYFLFSCVRLP